MLSFRVGPPGHTAAYWFTQYRASDVAENLGRYLSCTESRAQGNDFELIPTVKMETKHPINGYFGSESRAICNHCVVMAAWSRRPGNLLINFCVILEKRPLTVKFFKLCSKSFYRLTDRHCCVQISSNVADEKSVKSCVIYRTKKQNSPASQTIATARIAPKIRQGQPQQCNQSVPDFIQTGTFSTKL